MEWKIIPIISPSPLPYPHYIPIKTCHLGDALNPIKMVLWMGLWHWLYHSWWLSHKNPLTQLHHLGTMAPGCGRGRRRGCSPGRERSFAPPAPARPDPAAPRWCLTPSPASPPMPMTWSRWMTHKDRQIWIWMSRPDISSSILSWLQLSIGGSMSPKSLSKMWAASSLRQSLFIYSSHSPPRWASIILLTI